MFTFVANLGTVSGFWVGIMFIVFGVLGFIKNQKTLIAVENRALLRNQLLILLGIVTVLARVFILSKTFVWLGEAIFFVVGVAGVVVVLWYSPGVGWLGKVTLAVLGFLILMQPLHYLWMLTSQ